MNNRKIAGFMTAEGIYSLAFYIIMVAAIAGVGASILVKKDAAKAASAISLLRANIVADTATLGAPADMLGPYVVKMSGNLFELKGADAVLPDGAKVTVTKRSKAPSYSIDVVGLTSPEVCNAIGGVGWGTWNGFALAVVGSGTSFPAATTKVLTRTACDAAATAAVTLVYGFNI